MFSVSQAANLNSGGHKEASDDFSEDLNLSKGSSQFSQFSHSTSIYSSSKNANSWL